MRENSCSIEFATNKGPAPRRKSTVAFALFPPRHRLGARVRGSLALAAALMVLGPTLASAQQQPPVGVQTLKGGT